MARWVKAFREGRDAVQDNLRTGRPRVENNTVQLLASMLDYNTFVKVKEPLQGTRYTTRDELSHAIVRSIRNINKDGRTDGARRLPKIWQKVINKWGDYIEST